MCINVIIDIWVISGLSVLFVEEAGVQVKITDKLLSHKVVSKIPQQGWKRSNRQLIADSH